MKAVARRTSRRLLRTALAAVGLAAPVSIAAQPPTPTMWFAPLDPMFRPWTGYGGSVDYLDLFSPSAPWATAASHVQVFKIYASLVDNFTDDQLRLMFRDLDRRNIALAVEFGPLVPENCGFGLEGFNGEDALHLATRIHETGGTLRYVAMDEPYFFAHIYRGDNACQWSAQRIVANAMAQIAVIRQIFPGVQVGDIEPFPTQEELNISGWTLGFRAWLDAWKAAGVPLAFFHADIAWDSTGWQHSIDVLHRYAAEQKIPFGIIYNGLGNEAADADWLNHAESHFTDYETQGGAPPEQVIFQSWHPLPKHLLPESDPAAFTHLINRYFRQRTQLTISGDVQHVSGKLVDSANLPVAGAIALTAIPLNGPGVVTDSIISGVVPASATTALVGVRVNDECGCHGDSDVTLYRFAYIENSSTAVTQRDYTNGLDEWGMSGTAHAVLEAGSGRSGQGLHITAQPGQNALLNSTSFPVTPGSPYTLRITARVTPDSVGSGYFGIFFLAGPEVARHVLKFQAATIVLGETASSADGSYATAWPALDSSAYRIDAAYAGSDAKWPAAAGLFLQLVPSVATSGVVNAANYAGGAVSPGEIVTVFGALMGEPLLTTLELNADGSLASELFNTRVLFDGIPAPLIYASSSQLSAIVPYGIGGRPATAMRVEYLGLPSAAVQLPIAASAPGVFTLDASGQGAGAILNQDYSVNSPARPAARGSTVMIYATGEGETDPPGADGQITGTLLRQPRLHVTATIGSVAADVKYAGAAPGQVAGLLQVNVRIPEAAPIGAAVPVVLTIGAASTQPGVTMAVR